MTEHDVLPRNERLSPQAFERLLDRLGPDRTEAAERYQAIHRRISRLYEWRACTSPEDLADETLDRVASKLEDGVEVHSPERYILRVASLVFREIVRREQRQRLALEAEGAVRPDAVEDEEAEPELEVCFQGCLGGFDEEERARLLRYYEGQRGSKIRNRKQMALDLGLAAGTLRIRMHRKRRKLETCVRQCLDQRRGVTESGPRPPAFEEPNSSGIPHA